MRQKLPCQQTDMYINWHIFNKNDRSMLKSQQEEYKMILKTVDKYVSVLLPISINNKF